MVGAALAIMVVTALASFLLLKVLRLPIRSYLPALTIGNVGNLGCRSACSRSVSRGSRLRRALRDESVGQFTLVPLLQARTSFVRTLVATPVIYAAVGGLAVRLATSTCPGGSTRPRHARRSR